MPQQLEAPPGVRFFARIDRFHCECPSCAGMIVADLDPRRSRERDILAKRATSRERARADSTHPYNPFSCVLRCPWCRRTFMVGLLLWSVAEGAHVDRRQPPDTKPTRRQLAQLRAYADGRWPVATRRAGDAVNIAVVVECTCPPPDGWAPACPIHGSPEQLAASGQADRSKRE
jgi:hypothetical protein